MMPFCGRCGPWVMVQGARERGQQVGGSVEGGGERERELGGGVVLQYS